MIKIRFLRSATFMQHGFTVVAAVSILLISGCGNDSSNTIASDSTNTPADTTTSTALKPAGEKPVWGKDMTDPMAVVIEKLTSYGTPPLTTLSAEEARKTPSPADAVKDVMVEHNIPMPVPMVDTAGQEIPVAGGSIHARIYTPKSGTAPFPVIVYYHGGGWVIADLNTYDASASALAEQADAVLVSVHYRQAPEHKFPTAHNDSYAAYEWVLKNAASIKGDPKKVALVGESAGGNLAASVSMIARDKGAAMPLHEVLVYPIAGYDTTTESYMKNVDTKPLNKALMSWFFNKYLPSPASGNNPMISLVKANLKNMPPTTIILAEYDPLQSEGAMLGDKLKEAGVAVTVKKYNGVNHEFFGMVAIIPEAKEAQALAVEELKKVFKK